MKEHEQREIASLIRHRLAESEAAERAARIAWADIDLSEHCVGGKLDRAEALYRREAARAAATRRAAHAARLRSALHRVNEPDYGRCAVCGNPIPVGRLRADPAARRCPACTAPES